MIKKIITKQAGSFIGGLALGTVGLKALTSKPAKKLYANVLATGYHLKDELDETLDSIRQETGDVVADAKEIYQADKQADEAKIFARLEDTTDEA